MQVNVGQDKMEVEMTNTDAIKRRKSRRRAAASTKPQYPERLRSLVPKNMMLDFIRNWVRAKISRLTLIKNNWKIIRAATDSYSDD